MKKLLTAVTLIVCAYLFLQYYPEALKNYDASQDLVPSRENLIEQAFQSRISDLQVEGEGTVIAILPDDTRGSRHQRFIVEMSSGHTLLIVHNIDLAQRINSLTEGDSVEFNGEYEWNEKGGLVHWTHHDPDGRHADGWIVHNGVKYQ
jgi:hypothetical protein